MAGIELGTYRSKDGVLVHCWYESGVLMAEREGPRGTERIDPRALTGAVKLSEDPLWPDQASPLQIALWDE